jgi:hypothetical protein
MIADHGKKAKRQKQRLDESRERERERERERVVEQFLQLAQCHNSAERGRTTLCSRRITNFEAEKAEWEKSRKK